MTTLDSPHAVRESLLCPECKAFRIPTQDGRGAICPNGHGRTLPVDPDSYKSASRLNSKLPWLDKYPFATEPQEGVFQIVGSPGFYKQGRRVPDLEQPEGIGARIGDDIYNFTRLSGDTLAEHGYKPLAKIGGRCKWRGNALPEDYEYLSDRKTLFDRSALASEKHIAAIAKEGAHHKPVSAEAIKKMIPPLTKPGGECELVGWKEADDFRTLIVRYEGKPIPFDADLVAWARRAIVPVVQYRVTELNGAYALQLMSGEKHVAAAIMGLD